MTIEIGVEMNRDENGWELFLRRINLISAKGEGANLVFVSGKKLSSTAALSAMKTEVTRTC